MKDVMKHLEYEPKRTLDEYLREDKNLYLLRALIELALKDKRELVLSDFLKQDLHTFYDILERLFDAPTARSVEDKIYNQVLYIGLDLKIFKVRKIGYINTEMMYSTLVHQFVDELREGDADFLSWLIREAHPIVQEAREFKLKSLEGGSRRKGLYFPEAEFLSEVDFKKEADMESYLRHTKEYNDFTPYIAKHIAICVVYDTKRMSVLLQTLKKFVRQQVLDVDMKTIKPRYLLQIQELVHICNKLDVSHSSLLVPSSLFENDKVEIATILSFLEWEKKIEIKSWCEGKGWVIGLSKKATNLGEAIFGKKVPIFFNPSYDHQKTILTIANKEVSFIGRENQAWLLNFLFKQSNKRAEMVDVIDAWDEDWKLEKRTYEKEKWKKFFHIARQINNNIAIEAQLPKDKYIIIKKTVAQLNPKYFT